MSICRGTCEAENFGWGSVLNKDLKAFPASCPRATNCIYPSGATDAGSGQLSRPPIQDHLLNGSESDLQGPHSSPWSSAYLPGPTPTTSSFSCTPSSQLPNLG